MIKKVSRFSHPSVCFLFTVVVKVSIYWDPSSNWRLLYFSLWVPSQPILESFQNTPGVCRSSVSRWNSYDWSLPSSRWHLTNIQASQKEGPLFHEYIPCHCSTRLHRLWVTFDYFKRECEGLRRRFYWLWFTGYVEDGWLWFIILPYPGATVDFLCRDWTNTAVATSLTEYMDLINFIVHQNRAPF